MRAGRVRHHRVALKRRNVLNFCSKGGRDGFATAYCPIDDQQSVPKKWRIEELCDVDPRFGRARKSERLTGKSSGTHSGDCPHFPHYLAWSILLVRMCNYYLGVAPNK